MALFKASILVDHHAVKKNSRQIMKNKRTGLHFLGKSLSLSIAEQIMIKRLKLEAIKNISLSKHGPPGYLDDKIDYPITCDIQVTFTFYFQRYWTKDKNTGKLRRSKKIPDLSNIYQLPEDCLKLAGIIVDDSQIQSHDGSRIKSGDLNRLEIVITKMEESPT